MFAILIVLFSEDIGIPKKKGESNQSLLTKPHLAHHRYSLCPLKEHQINLPFSGMLKNVYITQHLQVLINKDSNVKPTCLFLLRSCLVY